MTTALRASLALALSTALSGCISFGAKPPPTLIRLTATQQAPADAGMTLDPNKAITVMIPSSPQEIAVTRVPVRSGSADLSYLKNAMYADMPAKLVRDLLMDTIRARTGRPTLEARDYHLAGGARLTSRIDTLSIDAAAGKVDMVLDAVLQAPNNGAATTRRFEAHVPVSPIAPGPAGAAIAQAANDVATQVADWIGR